VLRRQVNPISRNRLHRNAREKTFPSQRAGPATSGGQVKAGHRSRFAGVHAGIGRQSADISPSVLPADAANRGNKEWHWKRSSTGQDPTPSRAVISSPRASAALRRAALQRSLWIHPGPPGLFRKTGCNRDEGRQPRLPTASGKSTMNVGTSKA
jgi:hypothetical protein